MESNFDLLMNFEVYSKRLIVIYKFLISNQSLYSMDLLNNHMTLHPTKKHPYEQYFLKKKVNGIQ